MQSFASDDVCVCVCVFKVFVGFNWPWFFRAICIDMSQLVGSNILDSSQGLR